MKKQLLRCFSTALAALQIMFILGSCEENSSDTESDSADAGKGMKSVAVDTGLEERDLGGYEFKILVRSGVEAHCHHIESFTVDELNGEGVNDAVYNRQLALEERYNFKIKPVVVDENGSAWPDEFRRSVNAGDSEFDIGVGATQHCQALATSGYYIPWNHLDYVDLTKPWWNQAALESLSVQGNTFYTMGDLTYETMDFTYCMYFNKNLCEDWGITADSLYDTVRAGKWTLSYVYKLTKDIYSDLDGNGEKDVDDLYGITMNSLSGQGIFQNATDTLTVVKDNDDIPHIITNTEKLATLVERMYVLMYESPGTFAVTKNYSTNAGDLAWWAMTSYKLATHTSLFSTGLFYEAFGEYSDIDFNLGILPLPKYDARQERYQTACDYHGPFTVVPTTANTDVVGFCAEALAAYGKAYITPAYYETALKRRYADTDNDAQMIDIIMDGLVYDMYSVYTTSSVLQSIIYDHSYNFASYWKKNEKSMTKNFDKLVETFLEQ